VYIPVARGYFLCFFGLPVPTTQMRVPFGAMLTAAHFPCHPVESFFRGKLLHVSFSIRGLGRSTWFQDIGPPLSGKMTDGYSASETNRCSMLTPLFFMF
jgi:hypothetical protein